MNNRMTLELPSLSENGPFARDAVAAFCARLDPTLDELSDVKTAVSEAVTNCIVHAYPNAPGTVRIECAAGRGALHIRVIDYGRGIADVARALEPFYTTLVYDKFFRALGGREGNDGVHAQGVRARPRAGRWPRRSG